MRKPLILFTVHSYCFVFFYTPLSEAEPGGVVNNASWDIKAFQIGGSILSYKETGFSPAAGLDYLQKETERERVFLGHKEEAFPAKKLKVQVHIFFLCNSTNCSGVTGGDTLLIHKWPNNQVKRSVKYHILKMQNHRTD